MEQDLPVKGWLLAECKHDLHPTPVNGHRNNTESPPQCDLLKRGSEHMLTWS